MPRLKIIAPPTNQTETMRDVQPVIITPNIILLKIIYAIIRNEAKTKTNPKINIYINGLYEKEVKAFTNKATFF